MDDYKIKQDKDNINDEYYDNDYYYDSDEECEETEQEKLIKSVNLFLDNNYYNIILLLDDIKSRFFYNNPGFLCKLNSSHLINILVEWLYYDINISSNQKQLLKFTDKYINEIDVSYNILNTYLSKINCFMEYNLWAKICHKYSHLSLFT